MKSMDINGDGDHWATEGLIPSAFWHAAKMEGNLTARKLLDSASRQRITPGIPARPIKKEKGDYKIFNGLIANKNNT
jgi:hypothetical protein